MSASVTAPRHSIRISAAISPTIAARLALAAFFRPGQKMAVQERDAATDLAGYREYLRLRGQDVATYRWGTSDRTVLVLHGWQGRASQLAPMVRGLVSSEYRVVSFDAPAHGASDGDAPTSSIGSTRAPNSRAVTADSRPSSGTASAVSRPWL